MGSSIKMKSVVPAALLATGVLMGTAHAADLLVDPPVVHQEVYTKPAGGWYLRGDISYTSFSMDDPHYEANQTNGFSMFSSAELDDTYGLRLGVGYQINEYFRVDATYDYQSETDFNGTTGVGANVACFNGTQPVTDTNCTSTDKASLSYHQIMANAYVDLGSFSGITPYVGAGIGGARVSYGSLTNQTTCTETANPPAVPGGCGGSPSPFDATVEHPGEDSWRFAWALHAGASYKLTHAMKLDLGYSYNVIEEGAMFGYESSSVTSGLKGGPQGYDKGIENHTFRAGIRYQIW